MKNTYYVFSIGCYRCLEMYVVYSGTLVSLLFLSLLNFYYAFIYGLRSQSTSSKNQIYLNCTISQTCRRQTDRQPT